MCWEQSPDGDDAADLVPHMLDGAIGFNPMNIDSHFNRSLHHWVWTQGSQERYPP